MVGVPALVRWPWGPSSRICWPIPRTWKRADEDRRAQDGREQGDAAGDEEGDHLAARSPAASRSSTSAGHDPVVEGDDAGRRRPGSSRGPCRRPRPRRRGGRRPGPGRWPPAGRARPTTRLGPVARRPATSSMIASGSSRPGVVGREDGQVGQAGRDVAHERALGVVAVAAAAEDDDHPAGRPPAMLPGRPQARLQAGRACGRSRRPPGRAGPGRPARSGRAPTRAADSPSATAAGRHVELAGGGGRGQGVGHVERAAGPQPHRVPVPPEAGAVRAELEAGGVGEGERAGWAGGPRPAGAGPTGRRR